MTPDHKRQAELSEKVDLIQLAADLANRGFYVIGELHASPRPEPGKPAKAGTVRSP